MFNGNVVKKYYEQKLGIAGDAEELIQQMFNFWQYNCFVFGDDALLTLKTKELHNIVTEHKMEINSIAYMDDNYITLLIAKMNNDYHLFLASCLSANNNISKVNWGHIDRLPEVIKNHIQNRERPNFVLTSTIYSIADHSTHDRNVTRKREKSLTKPDSRHHENNDRKRKIRKSVSAKVRTYPPMTMTRTRNAKWIRLAQIPK
jgi:hypothetical protein